MFYRQHKTLWYQFCNFKHFLKAENSEDSLASSCVDFSIGLSCNPVWDWVVPMVTALLLIARYELAAHMHVLVLGMRISFKLLRTVTRELTEPQCTYEPTKNFIINFLFLNAWKLLKIMLKYPYIQHCMDLQLAVDPYKRRVLFESMVWLPKTHMASWHISANQKSQTFTNVRWYDMRSEDCNFYRNQTFSRRIDHLFVFFGLQKLGILTARLNKCLSIPTSNSMRGD